MEYDRPLYYYIGVISQTSVMSKGGRFVFQYIPLVHIWIIHFPLLSAHLSNAFFPSKPRRGYLMCF